MWPFNQKKTPEEQKQDQEEMLAKFREHGGFLIIGANKTIDGKTAIEAMASIKNISKARILFTVAQTLDMGITEVVASMEQYGKSQIFRGSPLNGEFKKKHG